MKTILATAYAVNPNKGSEDGMGWNFILQIARFHRVIAITRENNRTAIEAYIQKNPSELYERIQFLYFDLPYWMRFWKKGGRGAMLYYFLWQYGIVSFIRKQNIRYDIVHNLNFHNDWTPSFLWKLQKPFVWGPVGHHPFIPKQYLQLYRFSYWLKDRLTWMVKQYFWKCSYTLRQTKRNAAHIWCMNTVVPSTLKLADRYSVNPSVATQDFGWERERQRRGEFKLISAGRFVPLKGFDLAIKAFAEFCHQLSPSEKENCELLIVGSGPEESLLKELARTNDLTNQVKFIPWMERNELMQEFKTASIFLFPSHEGAGMVVAEALSFGLPLICLDNEGPGQFITPECGISVAQSSYEESVSGLSAALTKLYQNPQILETMRLAARQRFEQYFHWDRRGEQLARIYEECSV